MFQCQEYPKALFCTTVEVVLCLWTPVSVLGRSGKVIFTPVVVLSRLCWCVPERGT